MCRCVSTVSSSIETGIAILIDTFPNSKTECAMPAEVQHLVAKTVSLVASECARGGSWFVRRIFSIHIGITRCG